MYSWRANQKSQNRKLAIRIILILSAIVFSFLDIILISTFVDNIGGLTPPETYLPAAVVVRKATAAVRDDKDYKVIIDYNCQLAKWGNELAKKNNNPGNLYYAGQPTATKNGVWAKFRTPEQGFEALIRQVKKDQSRGFTIKQFVYKYAPPHENDTKKYIQFISDGLATSSNALIKNFESFRISELVAQFESQSKVIK